MQLPRLATAVARLVLLGGFVAALGCAGARITTNPPPHHSLRPMVDLAAPPEGYPATERDTADTLDAITGNAPNPGLRYVEPTPPGGLNVLALSGGGQYTAYAAGILEGWTCRGDRPAFDVVTGISSGALLAPLAFLGPKYDAFSRRMFSTMRTEDIFKYRPLVVHIIRDRSLASSDPLRRLIAEIITNEFVAEMAVEHCKGRRIFIGTMDVNTRRLVYWDLGAIAASGRPDATALIRRLLLASGSIPGLAPPVPIEIEVNGKRVTELHADGGGIAQTFMRFGANHPRPNPADPGAKWLAGSNLYVIAGGKLHLDVIEGTPNFFQRITGSISGILYAMFRADAWRLYTLCAVSGMRFHMTAVPQDMEIPGQSTTFDPAGQRALYAAGVEFGRRGGPWRTTPPAYYPGEDLIPRAGTTFIVP